MATNIKDKKTNNDLQNTTQKTEDQATRTPLKTGVNTCSGKVDTPCSTGTRRVTRIYLMALMFQYQLIWCNL